MSGRSIRILLAVSILIVPSDTRVPTNPAEMSGEAHLAVKVPAGATLTVDRPSNENPGREAVCPRIAPDGNDLEGEGWTVPVLVPLIFRPAFHFICAAGTARIEPPPASHSIVRLLC